MKWTAESAARSHFELRHGLLGAKAIRYDGDSGVIYPEECQCGSSKRRMDYAEPDFRRAAHCGSCGSTWPCRVVVDPQRIRSSTPLKYTFADLIVDLSRVMIDAERACIWGFRAFYLFHGERVGGARAVARRARELWPRASVTWDRRNVGTLRSDGRAAVETALDARALLYRPTYKIVRPEDAYMQTDNDEIT